MGALCFLPAAGCNFGIKRSGQLAQQNHQGQGVTLPTLLMAPDPRLPERSGQDQKKEKGGKKINLRKQEALQRKTSRVIEKEKPQIKGIQESSKGKSRASLQRRITRASDQRFGNTQDVGEKHKN